ncbi:MAG TPA: EAL domain-containing protein [Nannocystaceae bacterium]|nr:EAL domain-containing protein [Nannocystaceae bacterium]
MRTEGRPRVLFVDDDPSVLGNVRRSLWREPLEVLTAGSGAAALAILADTIIDVVVSDEKMPEMGGAELLTRVRERHPDACRILLSGQADLDAALRAINEARVFRFLTKPCPPPVLAGCIWDALRAREERRAAEQAAADIEARADRRRLLTAALRQTWIVVQPIVHAPDLALFAYEALARCDHPEITGPMHLFDLAEELDAVHEVEHALHALVAALMRTLPDSTVLFVNTHPRTLADPAFFDARNPLAPFASRIVLELTEREAVDSGVDLPGRIATLRALGFRIALDDLGSGYNGLNAFAELGPDIVKFDMALVRDMVKSATSMRLVGTMIELCRDLGIVTVGEGVETEAQGELLRSLGCNLLQGYQFGRPALWATWVQRSMNERK